MRRTTLAAMAAIMALAACTDIQTTRKRSALLNSEGPQITDDEVGTYLTGLETVRRFYSETADFDGEGNLTRVGAPADGRKIPADFTQTRLGHTRTLILAYVDARCDAYLDAIFWANRTRQGIARGNNAIGSVVSSVLGATGTPTNVMGIVAAAFGLSGSLFDSYYASVLYELDPSGVRHLVTQSQLVYRGKLPASVASKGGLLEEVQGYIRLCTPSHIDYLVGSALKKSPIIAQTPNDQATILFRDNWQVKSDGTVIDPNGTAYELGKKLPDTAPFELLDDGKIKFKSDGKIRDFKDLGLATWGKIKKAGGGDGAAPAAAPRRDDGTGAGDAGVPAGRSTIRVDVGG